MRENLSPRLRQPTPADENRSVQVFLEWWPVVAIEILVQWTVMLRVLFVGSHRSATSLAWLLVLLLLPGVGIALWFLMGESMLGTWRRRRHAALLEELGPQTARLSLREDAVADLPAYQESVSLAYAVGGAPPRPGNDVELMGDTDTVLERLVQDIDAAEHHCHLLFYIWLDDHAGRLVAAALERAAQRGVACRVLLDDVGARSFLRSATSRRMVESGVQVVRSLPASLLRVFVARLDMRNHRKLAILDGRVGYTGSQNIASASFAPKPKFAPWVDCMLRVEGPAVHDLQEIFINDWYLETEQAPLDALALDPPQVEGGVAVQVLPSGPSHDNEALEQMALSFFHRARQELCLTTPYFVPGDAEIASLCTAARRGVRVVIVLPARCDSRLVAAVSRSHYPELIAAGVEVHEFQEGLLHAKTLTVDRRLGLVTTANFDQRSFDLNYEVSTLVYDDDLASRLRFLQMGYVEKSKRVELSSVSDRSIGRRLLENAARVFSPLL